jgi:hypothetical protein
VEEARQYPAVSDFLIGLVAAFLGAYVMGGLIRALPRLREGEIRDRHGEWYAGRRIRSSSGAMLPFLRSAHYSGRS